MDMSAIASAVATTVAEQRATNTQTEASLDRFAGMEKSLETAEKQGFAPGQRAARFVRAFLDAGSSVDGALSKLRGWNQEGDAALIKTIEKSLSNATTRAGYSGPSGASLFMPTELIGELIPIMRPYSVIARRIVRMIKMNGNIRFPRISAASLSYWRPAQGSIKKAGTPSFGALTMSPKSLTGLAIVPNKLLTQSGFDADMFVLAELLAGLAYELDRAALAGKGSEYEPKGLINYNAGSGADEVNAFAGGALSSGQIDWTIPVKMMEAHITNHGTLLNASWVFHPVLWRFLMTATTGTAGFLAWMNEMVTNKTLLSLPFDYSVHIPVAATSNNPTKMLLLDWFEWIFGQEMDMQVSRSTEATVLDNDGVEHRLWQENETGIKCLWSGDFGLRNTKCCTRGDGIQTT